MSQGWNVATDLGYEDVIRKSPDGLCTFNTLLFAETGGINAIFSSPPGFRPTGPVFVGESRSVLTGSNLTGSIRMDQSGLATMPVGYYAGSAGPRAYYPVALHWRAA